MQLCSPRDQTFYGLYLGLEGPGLGLEGPGRGLHGPGLGLDGPCIDLDGPCIDLEGPGIGLEGPGIGLDGPGIDLEGPGLGLGLESCMYKLFGVTQYLRKSSYVLVHHLSCKTVKRYYVTLFLVWSYKTFTSMPLDLGSVKI